VNVWSGVGSALEDNQAVAKIMGKLAHRVKLNVNAMEKFHQVNVESVHLKTQFVGLYQSQKSEEMEVTQLGEQLYHLTMLLNQMRQEQQQKNLRAPNLNGPGPSVSEPVMVNGVPVNDVHCVGSRARDRVEAGPALVTNVGNVRKSRSLLHLTSKE
jgi:hypothetical protein